LAQEYLGFLLLNLFDLFLTGWIFKHEGHEGNAVANFVLLHFKLQGFAVFKFLMVVFIVLVCEVISINNLRTARMLVVGASLLYVAVILYECFGIWLFIDHPLPPVKTGVLYIWSTYTSVWAPTIDGLLHSVASPFVNGGFPRV